MAYIYQITNKVNNKIYIGKTERNIQTRFLEHCKASKTMFSEKRPLYEAMRKYGIKNFIIELIEETNNPDEREKFWIEQKQSFKHGYNATIGGDGKPYLDYQLLIETYQQKSSLTETAKLCSCDEGYLSQILKSHNIEVLSSETVNKTLFGHYINQYALTGEYIATYSSIRDAARAMRPNTTSLGGVTSHISDVCKGKRKSAYGYIWKYIK